ncbi:glycosyltransferase family 4 protein [Paenibacillus sp. J2TS4]|uniref:glycosyltransferase family 4 protein n=1 Tax=Paenibacillus sp. J2TS4 TaxID=2807194 RepID=UPI001B0EC967|nr:glycosyltransferase family 4 protein [Paenibacillus sp. J2TS4]GIP34666.1 hypothetical protein J2TS4_38760 [Paenibacillus sp. J2TS4]
MNDNRQPRIGMLWGDFPWTSAPKKLGKLWSMGRVARDVTYALRETAEVIPYLPPEKKEDEREEMKAFLQKIDLLWADLYPSSALALTLRKQLGLGIPAVLFAGGAMPKGAEAMLFPWKKLLQAKDGILFNCRADQQIWKRLVQWSHLQEWVVPLSVDQTVFYPRTASERQEARKQFSIPPDAPVLLYVGRLNVQKNLHTLLRLFAAVKEQVQDAYLCIVGEEDDIAFGEFRVRNTGYVEWLRGISDGLGISESVKWIGPRFGEELAIMYSAADVVVNMGIYHRENFGLSQAEAASCGVSVVCTAWGGFKDVVRHGETGYFVDAVLTKNGIRVDWASGVNVLIQLLQQRSLREEMGRRAAQFAKKHFSLEALANHLRGVVYEVLPGNTTWREESTYSPNAFAERYEANKSASGWYAAGGSQEAPWHPPMFQGDDYGLYETLMGPYSTRLAEEWGMESVTPQHVPYFAASVTMDSARLLLSNEDPIWPHRRFLTRQEWDRIRYVDGFFTLEEIAQQSGSELSSCIHVTWNLYLEGFILFKARA